VPAPGEVRPTLLSGAGKEYRNEQRTCQAARGPPKGAAFVGAVSSATATIEGHDLEGRGLDAFETADIDGGHGGTRRVLAEAERRAAAGGAEVVLDDVLVEQVGRERAFRRGQRRLARGTNQSR